MRCDIVFEQHASRLQCVSAPGPLLSTGAEEWCKAFDAAMHAGSCAPAVIVHDVHTKPPLHRAALIGDAVKLEALIAEGADVDEFDRQQMTALHMAAANGHMVKFSTGDAWVYVRSR